MDQYFYFIFDKRLLTKIIHIANNFHTDSTIWTIGEDKVEIVNNTNIKIRFIIPVLKHNIPKGLVKNFYLPYNIKNISLKNSSTDIITFLYDKDGSNLTIQYLNISGLPNIIPKVLKNSISSQILDKDFIETHDKEIETRIINTTNDKKINYIFEDKYNLDSITTYFTLDINNYNNIERSLVLTFNDVVNLITKLILSKSLNINITSTEDVTSFIIEDSLNNIKNKVSITNTFSNSKTNYNFSINSIYFTTLRGINIGLPLEDKNRHIFELLTLNLIKDENNIKGISIMPVIDLEDYQDYFIFMPSS